MLKLTLISGLCAVAAFAQTLPAPPKELFLQKQLIGPNGGDSPGPVIIMDAFAGPMSTIAGAPYSAQAITQRIQTLSDGNRITQTTTNNVARDSKGRVYREESLPALGNSNSEPPHLVMIDDPVTSSHISLDSSSKTATKLAAGPMKKADEAAAHEGLPPLDGQRVWFNSAGSGAETQIITTKVTDEAKAVKTDLGTQTVEGVSAKGVRITRTIPAGDMGNELPLVITTETWYSPDLKVLVMSKSTDPRMGETIYKLTNLSRSEPDPTLFQIPSDYTVKDQRGGVVLYKTKIDK